MEHKIDIESIYNAYIDDLYSYAIQLGFDRSVVMDSIQDMFYRICNSRHPLSRVENIRSYLFSALKKTLFNTTRGKKKFLTINDLPMQEAYYFNVKVTVEDYLISNEEEEKIRQTVNSILNRLSPRQREIVYLRYIEECDYEEISYKMGIDINSCHKLMHKAMSVLRKQFAAYPLIISAIIQLLLTVLVFELPQMLKTQLFFN